MYFQRKWKYPAFSRVLPPRPFELEPSSRILTALSLSTKGNFSVVPEENFYSPPATSTCPWILGYSRACEMIQARSLKRYQLSPLSDVASTIDVRWEITICALLFLLWAGLVGLVDWVQQIGAPKWLWFISYIEAWLGVPGTEQMSSASSNCSCLR